MHPFGSESNLDRLFAIGGHGGATVDVMGEVDDPAAQRQAGNPRRGVDADGSRKPVGLGRGVEIAEQRPGLDTDHPPVRVAAAHRSEVDHDPVVTHGVAGNVVPPALDRNHKILLTAEVNRGDHIGDIRAPGDESRPPVDHAVPEGTRLVVTRIPREQDGTLQAAPQVVYRLSLECDYSVFYRPSCNGPHGILLSRQERYAY